MAKMTKEEIVTALEHESQQAISAKDNDMAREVEKALDYYMGKPYGDEVEGQSKFVTREVLETIEGMMPYLVKVFFSSDQACVFEPEDEEDVDSAKQETEYVNWVFYKQNKGFTIGYTWLKDALMNKVGIVKAVREGCFGSKKTRYENLTEEQAAMVIEEAGEYGNVIDIFIDQDDDGLYNLVVETDEEDHKTVILNVPPENFKISQSDTDIDTARYVGEEYEKTISQLREMGFDVDDDISDNVNRNSEYGTVYNSRHEDVNQGLPDDDSMMEGPSRSVNVCEEYIYLDANDDGIAELIKVIRVGENILLQEEVPARPYHAWCPYMLPHKFHGLSAADLVMDIQRLKSRLWRNILDNQFLQINGRYAVVDGEVNLDDLMASAAHGIVRENYPNAVRNLETPRFGPEVFQVLGLVDQQSEKRSGVSERSSGLDPGAFNSNTAMGTTERVMDAAEQKMELLARVFAETGLKSLFLGIQRLGLMYEKPGTKIRAINGEFIPINPDEWRKRSNMTVTVGIGNGSKTHQMFQMSQIMATQQALVAGGGLGTLVSPTNIYNLALEQTRVLGRKDGSKFYTAPESDEIPEQGPSIEEQAKLIKAQTDQMKAQMEAQVQAAKVELEQSKQELEAQKLEFEKAKLAFEEKKHADDNEFRILEAKMELEQQRAVLLGKERDSGN